MWHAEILDTRLYAELQTALEVVLHHRPEGAGDLEEGALAIRLETMKSIYGVHFKGKPLSSEDAIFASNVSEDSEDAISNTPYGSEDATSDTSDAFNGSSEPPAKKQATEESHVGPTSAADAPTRNMQSHSSSMTIYLKTYYGKTNSLRGLHSGNTINDMKYRV